jgi:hypothetical protein
MRRCALPCFDLKLRRCSCSAKTNVLMHRFSMRIKALFLGIAPEKRSELERLWDDYQLQFCLFMDDKGVLMEGGAYRYVHFNHRALRVIWVSAFAAWEAYSCAQLAFGDGELRSFDRLQDLLGLALRIRDANDPEAVSLGGLPEPGSIPSDPQLRAPAELAMFAARHYGAATPLVRRAWRRRRPCSFWRAHSVSL